MSEILIRVSRGGHTECIHRGSIAMVDHRGNLMASVGDPDFSTCLRSCAKPLQALPILESGAAERFSFTPAELACMCGSLNGQDFQVQTVRQILSKIGLAENHLQCGVHPPSHLPTAQKMAKEGKKPGPLHNNCSGKHAAMLALCVFYGWPIDTYTRTDHPVQQLILDTVSAMTEVPREKIHVAIDGCGAPVFSLPLRNLAWSYAKLSAPPPGQTGGNQDRHQSIHRIVRAALDHPEMIAGDRRLCTELMRAAPGKVFAKVGAEGSYGLSLMGRNAGIAVKIDDGSLRALHPVVLEVLRQQSILSGESLDRLKSYGPTLTVFNHRQEAIGRIEPVFRMDPHPALSPDETV